MDDDARDRLGPPADRHRDVDGLRWLPRHAVQFSSGVVAEGGARTCPQDCRPQQRHPAWLTAEGGKDAAVNALPAAAVKLRPDRIRGQARQ
jgi:hypothetical protein